MLFKELSGSGNDIIRDAGFSTIKSEAAHHYLAGINYLFMEGSGSASPSIKALGKAVQFNSGDPPDLFFFHQIYDVSGDFGKRR